MIFQVEKIHKDILDRVRAGEPFYIIVGEMFEDDSDMRDQITKTEMTVLPNSSLRSVFHLYFKDGSEASITRWYDRYLNDDTAVTIWYSSPTGEPDRYLFYTSTKSQS